jgi:hypothetical protein
MELDLEPPISLPLFLEFSDLDGHQKPNAAGRT